MDAMLVLLIVLLVLGGGLYLIVRWFKKLANRGREIRLLAEQGEAAVARVTKLERIPRNRAGFDDYYITYRFLDGDGREFEKRISATPGEVTDVEEGGAYDVVYLPSDPSISAAADMVGKMREGLRGQS